MNSRIFHIGLSFILSAAALAVGGYFSRNNSASLFNLRNLFGHGLFVLLVFPAYCVFFYWATYPFFRVPPPSVPTQQKRLSGVNSWISVFFSLIGFLIPPCALVGIITGHLTLIRLRTIKPSKQRRLAMTGLILGHLTLGFWVCLFFIGFIFWGVNG